MRLMFRKPVVTPLAAWPLAKAPVRTVLVFDASDSSKPSKHLRQFVSDYLKRPCSLRVLHLSSNDNPQRTGIRVGVAIVE